MSDSKEATRPARIRLGMVGGGQGAFIGAVHRIAARMDDGFELVAGAFSSDPLRASASGAELGLDPARSYASYEQMALAEKDHPEGIEAVAIVTPNHLHVPVARAFLRQGIHVICDKPLATSLAEARTLEATARHGGALFILTHNYTGYPMIRQAQAMIKAGDLGDIRLVQVEYAQDWLAEPLEGTGNKQASWRTDPARAGVGGATGDIGTHAYHLAGYVTGLTLDMLAADLQSFGPGRQVDDNAHVMLRYQGGARGMLWCSQVASGLENDLRLRVFGTKAGIEWRQEDPNYLWVGPLGQPRYRLSRNGAGTGPESARMTRIPPGHPEGYLEAFANLYSEAAKAIIARRTGTEIDPAVHFPGLDDGLQGMAFVEACVQSSRQNAAWVSPAP